MSELEPQLPDRKATWIRFIAATIVAISIGALIESTIELVEALSNPSFSLSAYPRDMQPSSNFLMRNYYRFIFASAVFRATLAPIFLIGGLLLFQYRETGRKLIAVGFGVQIAFQGLIALLSSFSLVLSFVNPNVYPATLGLFLLAGTTIIGSIWIGFFLFFQSNAVRNACHPIQKSPLGRA